MNKIDKKRAQISKLNSEINKLENLELSVKWYPRIRKKLEGLVFKYRNCYSCPETESDYWWLYRRVTLVNRDGTMIYDEIQIDKYGELTVEVAKKGRWHPEDLQDSKWIKASEGDWASIVEQARLMVEQLYKPTIRFYYTPAAKKR